MTVREELHLLLDQLSDPELEQASRLLRDLKAGELDEEPLTSEDMASLQRGLEDHRAGRVKTLDEYEHERGL